MKSSRPALLLALLTLLGASCASAATLILDAVADTFVREDNAITTSGAANSELLVGQLSASAAMHALITFDLSTIPDGATINSVSLVLRQQTEDTTSIISTVTLDLHLVTEAFIVNQTSWTNRATGTAWSTPGGTFDSTVLSSASVSTRPSQVAGTLPVDVTWASTPSLVSLLQDSIDANEVSLSFLIKDANEDNVGRELIRFASIEGGFTPQLIIDYVVIPEPSTMALLIGSAGLLAAIGFRRRR